MLRLEAKITYNKKIIGNYFRCIVKFPKIAKLSLPGQFLNIRVADISEPLLRRPFSIHSVNGGDLEILYEVLGKGTQLLSQRKAGEYLDVIGPLGNGFSLLATCLPARQARYLLLIAGGMGVAPLLFLAEQIIKRLKVKGERLKVLLGAKTKEQILCEKEFKALGCEVKIATDDGSRGFKGKVTDLLRDLLATRYLPAGEAGSLLATIYACGPRPMLKEIAVISKKYNIPAQISLEEHMACGIGACLGCVVNTKEGYKRVCKEGPVFKAREIIW